jgi:hypothetical protein
VFSRGKVHSKDFAQVTAFKHAQPPNWSGSVP